MALRVAEEWLSICAGCEISILDIGEDLVGLLPALEFVHMPVIMDHKYHGQTGEKDVNHYEIPDADVGIISGSIGNEKEKAIAIEMRKKCKTLISLGSCACFGGIPAQINNWTEEEFTDTIFKTTRTTESAELPQKNLPKLTDRVYAVDEFVKVDISIPGCPPSADWIKEALLFLAAGKPFNLPEKSVCDECPAKRSEKTSNIKLKRPLTKPDFEVGKPYEEMKCLLEQGYVCLGPVTKAGCAGISAEKGEKPIPRCIKGYMPCRGCFGPVKADSNPLVDFTNALSSTGISVKDMADRKMMLLRYTGAHKNLKPAKKK